MGEIVSKGGYALAEVSFEPLFERCDIYGDEQISSGSELQTVGA